MQNMKRVLQKIMCASLLLCALTVSPQSASASSSPPDPASSPVMSHILKSGAKAYYLGTRNGLDGWFIVKDGRVQVAYTSSDKKNLVLGVMFGEDGESITNAQVKALIDTNKEVADLMKESVKQQQATNQTPSSMSLPNNGALVAQPSMPAMVQAPVPAVPQMPAASQAVPQTVTEAANLSPAERLLQELTAAPGVVLGAGTPKLYMIMDVNCPHCQAAWRVLRDSVMHNNVQLKMIPIAPPGKDSERAAAQLLRAADPLNAWDKYVGPDKNSGDKNQLAGDADATLVASIQANHFLVDSWHITQTPYFVYRNKLGKIKILVGEPIKPTELFNDLGL